MRLEDIAVNLRVRNPYEAIDLGYAMAMVWRRDVFPVWISVYLGFALVINLLCFAMPIVAFAILWWLKPAFDRVILHVLSGAAFGDAPTMRETWQYLPKLWWNNGLFKALTIGRFDLARSFNLPVTQLERQFGKPARQRRAVLGREGRGAAVWLTFASVHFELLLSLCVYFFIALLVPGAESAFNPYAWFFNAPTTADQYLSNATSVIAVLVLEPFFVAAGFALYLNTRTVLEGWDIELAFKQLNTRLTNESTQASRVNRWASNGYAKSATLVICILFAGAILIPFDTASAQPSSPEPVAIKGETISPPTVPVTPSTGAQARAKEVLKDPTFGQLRTTWTVKYIGPGANDKPVKPKNYPWLEKFGEFLALAFRFLAWIVGGVAVIALLIFLVKQWERHNWGRWLGRQQMRPDMLFGLDVRPESLPENVADAARVLLARGDIRGALSLLYRGALVFVIHDGKVEIARGDTEGLCVRSVSRQYGGSSAALPQYFSALVNAWQRAAYAGSSQTELQSSRAIADVSALIDTWTQYFQLPTKHEEMRSTVSA